MAAGLLGAAAVGVAAGLAINGDSGSEHTNSDDDDEDDYVDVLPVASKRAAKPRASVSAEAFGTWNKKGDFTPRVIEKSEADKQAIRDKLNQAFMFSALDDAEKNIVIDAME